MTYDIPDKEPVEFMALIHRLLRRSSIAASVLMLMAASLSSTIVEAQAQEKARYSPEVYDLLKVGSQKLGNNQLQDARNEYEKVLRLRPDCHEAYNNIGLTFYRSGDLNKAASYYMKALELEPLFVPSITNLGVVRYKQRRLADATRLFRLALKLTDEKDSELQFNLANVLRDQKKYEEARRRYVEAINLKPDFYAAHNGLGVTYYLLKNFSEAEKEVHKSIDLKPDYSLAYYHLGLIQSAQGKEREAVDSYETSLKFETNKSYADDTRSKIAFLRSKMKSSPVGIAPGAVRDGRGAGDNDRTSKAIALLRAESYPQAEKELKNLLDSGMGNDPHVWHDYGYALYNQNDGKKNEQAIKAYRKALSLSGGNTPQTHYNLAQSLRLKGDFAGSERECQAAINSARSLQQVCPLAFNLQGILYKRKGDLKKADQAYRLALAQSMGKYPVIHYNHALLLEKMNRGSDAKREYKTYIGLAPDGMNANRAKRRLQILGSSAQK